MPLTPAEKQKRYRDRQRDMLERLKAGAAAGNVTEVATAPMQAAPIIITGKGAGDTIDKLIKDGNVTALRALLRQVRISVHWARIAQELNKPAAVNYKAMQAATKAIQAACEYSEDEFAEVATAYDIDEDEARNLWEIVTPQPPDPDAEN